MLRAARALTCLALCALIAAAAPVGPFGVKFGQPFASLKQIEAFGNSGSMLVDVPEPHSMLTKYAAKADPAGKVCLIDAMAFLPNDGGRSAIRTFTSLRDELNAAYGPGDPGRSAKPLPGADSEFWIPGHKGGLHTMVWSAKAGAKFPPEWGVRTVMLIVAVSKGPIVHLIYFSENGCK